MMKFSIFTLILLRNLSIACIIFGVGSKVRSGVAGTPFAQEGVSIGPRALGELYHYKEGYNTR